MKRAFVFPGQGAQVIGMGRDLAEAYPAARAVFEEVDDSLGEKLSRLIWQGDIAELTLTANAQPALMAASLAAFRAMEAEGFGIEKADFVAGHSLGEYSALCAAGALALGDTARLLRLRGRAMLLPVSAPFHCAMMAPAAEAMEVALAGVALATPAVPLVANVAASAVSDPEEIRRLLVEQVTGRVRWRESVLWMAGQGVTEMIEIGAGKALSGMIRRIDREVAVRAVGAPADVEALRS